MKKILFLVLLLVANVTFGQDIYTNESIGFSMEQPPTWIKATEGQDVENLKSNIKLDNAELKKVLERSKGTVHVVSFYKYPIESTFGMIPTIKVNLKSNPHKNIADLKKSVEDSFVGIRKSFPDFKCTNAPAVSEVNGKQCVITSFMYTVSGKEGSSKVKTILYAIPVKDKYYQVTLIDTEKDTKNLELFLKIMNTVVIK